jgi:hypothetical protein
VHLPERQCPCHYGPLLSSQRKLDRRGLSTARAGTLPAEGRAPDQAAGSHRLYREQERGKRVLGWRRTHKDPFEGEWEQILSWLMANPERNSGGIFRELQRLSPGRYHPMQIRTFQRGMRNLCGCLWAGFSASPVTWWQLGPTSMI